MRHLPSYFGNLRRGLAKGLFAFFVFGYVKKEARLFEPGPVFFPGIDNSFERGLLFEDTLSLFAVVPEIRP